MLLQRNRPLQLATPLGLDALVLTAFEGTEALSRLFEFHLEAISELSAISANQLAGQNVTWNIEYKAGERRYFNGFVARLHAGDQSDRHRRYAITVVPWLWFLTRTSDCRIFQRKDVREIFEQVFTDLGFADFEFKLRGNHPKREYCVQYRETDFNFVSRLMEEEGIYYYFRHSAGKHTLVMSDHTGGYFNCKEAVADYPYESSSRTAEDCIRAWEHRFEYPVGRWTQQDYNFETPYTNLTTDSSTVLKLPNVTKYEVYDYPGTYLKKDDGTALTNVRMEEEEVKHETVHGRSGYRTFSAGGKFAVRQHPVAEEQGRRYLLTSVQHRAVDEVAYERSDTNSQHEYGNSFTCIPDTVIFRPPRTTRKPFVQGVQTAVVVGPPGEEIYPDKYGRVKVQFHWDREGKRNEDSSCWVRVAQVHAGKGFGGIDIPRIGEEVIISFLEGDPDRPIITGRVYHAGNMPPFSLPAEMTRSGIKTQTHKGDGYNEITLDDTAGSEQIRIHGQHNMDTLVENDETHVIGNDRTKNIGVNETMLVGKNQSLTVGNDRTTTVGNNHAETVGTNQTVTIGANQSTTIGAMKSEKVGSGSTELVGAFKSSNIGTAYALTIGSAMNVAVGFASFEQVGMNKSLVVGNDLKISAGNEIEIVCGDSKLVMKEDGTILLEGKDIVVKGSGKISVKATADLVLKGAKIGQN